MSTLFDDRPTVPLPLVRARPRARLNWITEYVKRIVLERSLATAERELRALDDRMLKDIGLDRSEIGSVLRDYRGERRIGRLV